MPNPYVLLAGVLGMAVCGWAGYGHGRSVEAGKQALIQQDAIVLTHQAARADAEAESERRAATALRDARAAAASREAKLKGQLHALSETPRPDCRWPAARIVRLNTAIDAANGTDPDAAPAVVPDAVPAADEAR